jgi:hypothetical protein
MTAIIDRTKDATPPPVAGKDGEYYDRCPSDGCVEVDRVHKNGGRTLRTGEEYLNWSMFNADPRKGGCGYSWARTTKQGQREDQERNINPKWLTGSAQAGRSYSLPTEQFRDNFERIDWSK